MDFLHFVCSKFGLGNLRETIINDTKVKIDINISFNNIKNKFLEYLIFCGAYSLFFIISCGGHIKINFILTLIIWLIVTGTILIIRRMLLRKEPQPKNVNIYNRELPDNLTPAHARLLVYDGVVDSYTIVSTILDLINRGYLKISNNNEENIFKKNSYLYKTNKSLDELFDYEIYLIDWLFENQNDSSQITNLTSSKHHNFEIFQGLVLLSFPFARYYVKKEKKTNKSILLGFIVFFAYMFFNNYNNNLILLLICEFICYFCCGYWFFISRNYTLNTYGADIKDSYLDLKRFLKDFSAINKKTSEMVMLWDFYLSYSVALNLNGTAYNEINNLIDSDSFYTYINGQYNDDYYNSNYDNILKHSQILYSKRK